MEIEFPMQILFFSFHISIHGKFYVFNEMARALRIPFIVWMKWNGPQMNNSIAVEIKITRIWILWADADNIHS